MMVVYVCLWHRKFIYAYTNKYKVNYTITSMPNLCVIILQGGFCAKVRQHSKKKKKLKFFSSSGSSDNYK